MVLLRAISAPSREPVPARDLRAHSSARAYDEKENEPFLTASGKQIDVHVSTPSALIKSTSAPEPSTPAARIPLADLIGDAEKASNTQAQLRSPVERVQWRTAKSPQELKTPAPRSRKRALSSSPSSSISKTVNKRNKTEPSALDLTTMAQSLKTPMTDPATDLWNKYAPGASKQTPQRPRASAISHLLESSSPQLDATGTGNVKGLRRWTSCGVEWPSSKSKRKPTKPVIMHDQTDKLTTLDFQEADERSRPNGVSNLLARIQQSLVKEDQSSDAEDAPPSSSPGPLRREEYDRKSISPLRASDLASRTQLADPAKGQQSDTTSFGSDGIDSDIFQEVVDQQDLPLEEAESRNDKSASSKEESGFDDDFGSSDDFDSGDLTQIDALIDMQSATQAPTRADISLIDDEFGFDDDEDFDEATFEAAEIAATQALQPTEISHKPSCSMPRPDAIQRYLVRIVSEGQYIDSRGLVQPEKVLLVDVENSTEPSKSITLHGSWIDTRCTEKTYVHVIGEFDVRGHIIIDDSKNMIILHPDHLISALVVADSFDCIRRAVLQDRIKATSDSSPPMLYGTILHEIFQETLKAKRWDQDFLGASIAKSIALHIEDLYQIKLTPEHVTEHLWSKMSAIQGWCEVFLHAQPNEKSVVKDRNDSRVSLSVSKLLDVEEHIWSPMYGLKGNIDASVQISLQDAGTPKTLIAPFEIKTGKRPTASHRAQTALYTLLLSDRYDVAVAYGILYYTETSEISLVPAIRHELRHMIMQRNELACYVHDKLSLPPMVQDARKCNNCYAKTSCFLYHRLAENGDGETSGMRDKFTAITKQLKPIHQAFFQKWDDLLTKEEAEMMRFRRELWTMKSSQREGLGRAFANVILETVPGACSHSQANDSSKINRYGYTFTKADYSPQFSFAESQLIVGEPIVVSDEKGHYALAKGYVTAVLDKRISVAVDRHLLNARTKLSGFDDFNNQVFSGITDSATTTLDGQEQKPLMYRLDKDEFSNGMATVRNNLISIMHDSLFGARALRQLVVDGRAPVFKPKSSNYELSGPQSQLNINDDQREAIEKIMCAEDYALVLGMPGTGKTTTIAHIIRALVAKGKSVLLTSYTHTAVDNILLKLKNDAISVLRLGAITKVHPEVCTFATLAAGPWTSLEEIRKAYNEPQIVATTCLGIRHQLFNERVFDYCIVDEASQITLPVCLGPIRMARTFVLVGDHFQLPPLVQNKDALKGGLDISLFKLLCEQHPSAVATLRHQYRMNAPIMSLANTLVYDGTLVCGTEQVAQARLDLPLYKRLVELHESPTQDVFNCSSPWISTCWLQQVLHPLDSSPVVFINTDLMRPASLETQTASRITNNCEATLISRLSRALILAGLSPASLGIITLYRSQLALIKSTLRASRSGIAKHSAADIEAHTADRYQGRDKEVILLSCVRSNDRACIGDLLKDWRRINVAVTRARRKLIIVGSRETLSKGDALLAKLVSHCEVNNWIIDLPLEAAEDKAHLWSCAAASSSATAPAPTSLKVAVVAESQSEKCLPQDRSNANRNYVNKPFKRPAAVGKISTKAALGGARIEKRSVLANIVNEVMSDEFLDDDFL